MRKNIVNKRYFARFAFFVNCSETKIPASIRNIFVPNCPQKLPGFILYLFIEIKNYCFCSSTHSLASKIFRQDATANIVSIKQCPPGRAACEFLKTVPTSFKEKVKDG